MKTTGKPGKKKAAGKKPAASTPDDKRLDYDDKQLRPTGRRDGGYKTK